MRYEPDRQGLDELVNTTAITEHLRRCAEAGADYARANAPRRTGAFADSIAVTPARSFRGTRPRFDLTGHVNYKDEVEQRHHVIERAIDVIENGGGH